MSSESASSVAMSQHSEHVRLADFVPFCNHPKYPQYMGIVLLDRMWWSLSVYEKQIY